MEKTTSRLEVGLKIEVAVISALGKTKNTKTVSAPVDGTNVNTIHDYIDDTAKEVGEIKDYADGNVLSNIKQIRAQMKWTKNPNAAGKSKAVAYNYKLYLNECSQRSKNLIEAMDAEGFDCYEISSLLTK